MAKNRIAKYFKEELTIKVVIVSDLINERIVLSTGGASLIWKWEKDGLLRPGAIESVKVHPLAAEALAISEIEDFLNIEGLTGNEVIFIDDGGQKLDNMHLDPKCLGKPTYDSVLRKMLIKTIYDEYRRDFKVTEELVGKAISCGALGAFLSLVNL